MANEIKLEDLVVMDQKEQRKHRLQFQNVGTELYTSFIKEHNIKVGDKLNEAQAEKFATEFARRATESYMKEKLGVKDYNPNSDDIKVITENVLGINISQLTQQLKNQMLSPDVVADISANIGDQVLQFKQRSLASRLAAGLLEKSGDKFRGDFAKYFSQCTGGKELDKDRLMRMDANLFLQTYRVLSGQNEALQTLHAGYIIDPSQPKKP